MFTLSEIFGILLVHGICDYLFQTQWQATNKSKNWKALLTHTLTYSTSMGLFLELSMWNNSTWTLIECKHILLFVIITFIAHTITDYFTSRLNTKLYLAGKQRQFFWGLEVDQLLHYGQLFITYWYLFK